MKKTKKMNESLVKHENDSNNRALGIWSVVNIELTSFCNFRCSFCVSENMARKKSLMPKYLWEKIIYEIGQKKMAQKIFFHVLGEPLLHRDLCDAIHLANSYDLPVSLYTNGALLDKTRASKLLDSFTKGHVVLSMQDISSDAFNHRVRGELTWERYIQRLQNFIKFAAATDNLIEIVFQFDFFLKIYIFFLKAILQSFNFI